MIYAEITIDDCFVPAVIAEEWTRGTKYRSCVESFGKRKLPSKAARVTLVVNTHRAVIRVAELTGRDRRLSPAVKWRLVQENFPVGALLNAETHIFDGSVFNDSTGRQRFMMVALPKAIAEPIGAMAEERWGSVHRLMRLDTIEHMIFRYFTCVNIQKENPLPLWVVFPQGMGFRILCLENGLPMMVHYISNHPELRLAELDRAWEVASPERAVILIREKDVESDAKSNNAIMPGADAASRLDDAKNQSLWLQNFARGRGVIVENRTFCCPACFVVE